MSPVTQTSAAAASLIICAAGEALHRRGADDRATRRPGPWELTSGRARSTHSRSCASAAQSRAALDRIGSFVAEVVTGAGADEAGLRPSPHGLGVGPDPGQRPPIAVGRVTSPARRCRLGLRRPRHDRASCAGPSRCASVASAAGRPLAAPSANRSGRVSATNAQHVADDLGSHVAMILDGGATQHGIESTIVSLADERPSLLRPGAIPIDRIEAVLGAPLARQTERKARRALRGSCEATMRRAPRCGSTPSSPWWARRFSRSDQCSKNSRVA